MFSRALRHGLPFAACCALLVAPAAGAQTLKPVPDVEWRSSWTGEISTLGINALIGGLTAAIPQLHRGGPGEFLDRFARGALGGSVGYVGKRLAVERWSGAGFLGRETNAVGASMIANAAEGHPLLSQVILPVGPVRLYVRPNGGLAVNAKLDLAAAVATAYAATRPETRLDLPKSLSAGAPVFFTESRLPSFAPEGHHAFGAVRVETTEREWNQQFERAATIFAHERVHVLQHDLALQAWGMPAQQWLLPRVPGGRFLDRYVDLGLHSLAWAGLNAVVPYDDRPWEREAYFLSNRPPDTRPASEDPSGPTFHLVSPRTRVVPGARGSDPQYSAW